MILYFKITRPHFKFKLFTKHQCIFSRIVHSSLYFYLLVVNLPIDINLIRLALIELSSRYAFVCDIGFTIKKLWLKEILCLFLKAFYIILGNSCQVSDGAAAVLLMKRSLAMKKGLSILGVFRYILFCTIDLR